MVFAVVDGDGLIRFGRRIDPCFNGGMEIFCVRTPAGFGSIARLLFYRVRVGVLRRRGLFTGEWDEGASNNRRGEVGWVCQRGMKAGFFAVVDVDETKGCCFWI